MSDSTITLTPRERIERIFTECDGVWSGYGINSWERARLQEWRGRAILTERQMEVLKTIEKKAFPDG